MRISVIIPAYNCAGYLARCIESLKAQSYTDWECNIIDDGSQDDSLAEAVKCTRGDHRFWIFRGGKNKGVGAARNLGIRVSKRCDALFFLDADDWIGPEMLSYLVSEYEKHPEVGRIFTRPIVHRESDNSEYVWCVRARGVHSADSEELFRDRYNDLGHMTGCLYIPKNIKTELVVPESVRVMEDLVFNIGLIFSGITTLIAEKSYYHYTRRNGSLVTAFPFSYKNAEDATRVLLELRDKYNPKEETFLRCCDRLNQSICGQLAEKIKTYTI